MKKLSTVALLASALSMTCCLAAFAQKPSGAEIFKNWIGKPLDAETAKGAKVVLMFAEDGRVTMTGAFSDNGRWRMHDDGYCTTWEKSRSGKEECYNIVPEGKIFLINFKGNGELSGKITPR